MRRRALATLAAALLTPACVAWQDPRPGPVRAMAPRPNPPAAPPRAAAAGPPQRARWVTQFWEELTPAQRRLVSARMRRRAAPRITDAKEAQAEWDVMGLPEREALILGRPSAVAAAQEAPDRRAEAEGPAPQVTR